MLKNDNEKPEDELKKLLARRDDYFLLTALERQIYRKEFEKMQARIIAIKLHLEIWHDELDLVTVEFNYCDGESKEKYKILEEAKNNREIRWLSIRHSPRDKEAVYIGLILKDLGEIKNDWLREICLMQKLKREGLISCPWPTKLEGYDE